MTLNDYQTRSASTRPTNPNNLTVFALGIGGEAGEVLEHIKKHVGHGHPLDTDKVTRELGDLMWYVAAMANEIGVDLDTVATVSLAKLRARYPDGFSSERSINRTETT